MKHKWSLIACTAVAMAVLFGLCPLRIVLATEPPPGLEMGAEAAFGGHFKYGDYNKNHNGLHENKNCSDKVNLEEKYRAKPSTDGGQVKSQYGLCVGKSATF